MKTYVFIFCLSMLLSMVLTPVVFMLAYRNKLTDIPDARNVHKKPVPRIGGVAIFVSTMSLVIAVLFLNNRIGESLLEIKQQLLVFLAACTLMFVVGIVDDIVGLRARYKLALQVAAAVVVCSFGIRVNTIAIENFIRIDFGWLSWPLTIFWIVGVTNAMNIIDGLDGLAAGISAITCGVIAILAVHFGQAVMAVLMLALLGSLTGFLFFNFNPAQIFLGDCGSMFLGFTIAVASVMCSTKSHALVGLALPVLVLGIPIFDTLFSMLRRFLERRSMFAPDRRHFHHRLLDLGLKQHHVVIVIYAVTLLAAGLGMFMMVTRNIGSLIVFICILLLLLLVFRVVGSVRLRETIAGLRQKYAVTHQMKEEVRTFESLQLHFRQAKTFDDWWQALCLTADKMDFMSIKLPLIRSDKMYRILTWQRDGNEADSPETVKMKIPIRDIKAKSELNLEVDVNVSGSLESAGRRAAMFSRLLDEHSVIGLPAIMGQNLEQFEVKIIQRN